MIRKNVKRFSLATNVGRVCAQNKVAVAGLRDLGTFIARSSHPRATLEAAAGSCEIGSKRASRRAMPPARPQIFLFSGIQLHRTSRASGPSCGDVRRCNEEDVLSSPPAKASLRTTAPAERYSDDHNSRTACADFGIVSDLGYERP